ncbi:MAG: phage tail tape measure protein [Pseudonocardiaceae bacterium]|nr:MAG: phage tail tape measure protein [Pseudonocardiaceae bacterium]
MATGFSVRVDIGGRVLPSLAASVGSAKAQVKGLEATLTGIGARINAPFIAAQKTIANTSKHLAKVQRHGRNLAMTVTAPAAFLGASMFKGAVDFEKALNLSEALGDLPSAERSGLETLAQNLAKRYDAGGAAGIVKTTMELMKAGLTFEQAKGSLEQVLATAAVSGDMTAEDVGASLSKSLAQFQMPAATLDQVTKSARLVTDRMTYAAVSTVASMKDISESFKYAGGVMSATGNGLDQTTAMVMSFANAGVLGAESGVALRSALVRLVKMPKNGLAALSRIGMNLGDYTSARPVTGKAVVGGLQAGGIDASKIERQIDGIIKANAGRGPAALGAAITQAVQSHLGSSSAVDASTIAESVNAAITAAGSKVDVVKFFSDLKAKFDSGAAGMGDIAAILEARHISRYMALLRTDLPALIAQVGKETEGYAQSRYGIVQKGLPAELTRLAASFDLFQKSLVKAVAPEISAMFERIADGFERIGKANPLVLKLGVGLTAIAAAAGPLMFAAGALGRLGTFAIGALLAPISGLAQGVVMLGGALAGGVLAGLARLRAAMAGLLVLNAVGGAGAVFSALGGGLLALGRSVLMFPVVALRAIGMAMWALVANPVGIIIGTIVAALTALGVWVYNNWNGIKQFFSGFGESFMEGLGPAGDAVRKVSDGLGSVVSWLDQLLGPISATDSQWKSWGATLGGGVASGVALVISGISKLIGFLSTVASKAIAAGSAIRGMFSSGSAPAPMSLPKPAGARALGGPVSFGKPYLVGERGPELFVPGATGRIETNNTLRRLTTDGTAAVAATESRTVRSGAINVTNHWTINGADDPRGVADQIDSRFSELMRRLESEQRGLLSD